MQSPVVAGSWVPHLCFMATSKLIACQDLPGHHTAGHHKIEASAFVSSLDTKIGQRAKVSLATIRQTP